MRENRQLGDIAVEINNRAKLRVRPSCQSLLSLQRTVCNSDNVSFSKGGKSATARISCSLNSIRGNIEAANRSALESPIGSASPGPSKCAAANPVLNALPGFPVDISQSTFFSKNG